MSYYKCDVSASIIIFSLSSFSSNKVREALSKNGFDIIETSLNHCEMFGGGVHCSTLDLDREDEYIDYIKITIKLFHQTNYCIKSIV